MTMHKKIFRNMLLISLGLAVAYTAITICFGTKSIASNILLALLSSAAITTIIELLNYFGTRRSFIIRIIHDNNIITNYICDSVWYYRNAEHIDIKTKVIKELYLKTQQYTCVLMVDIYDPFTKRGELYATICNCQKEIVNIWDRLLEADRFIDLHRCEPISGEFYYNDSLENIIIKLNQYVDMIDQSRNMLCKNNETLLKSCGLLGIGKVKTHGDIVSGLVEDKNQFNNKDE